MRAKHRSPLVLALVFLVVLLGRVDGMDAISTYIYICIRTSIYVYISIDIHIEICMCVCVCVCVCV